MHKTRDLLLTGHEDGSIKFWDVSSTTMELLYKVHTAGYFEEGFVETGIVQTNCLSSKLSYSTV